MLREASTISVYFILMLPACLGRREINERKTALAVLKFLLQCKWSLTTNKKMLFFHAIIRLITELEIFV